MVERSFDLMILRYDDQEIVYTLQDVIDALQTGRETPVILLTEQHVREGNGNLQVLSKWAEVDHVVLAIGRACC